MARRSPEFGEVRERLAGRRAEGELRRIIASEGAPLRNKPLNRVDSEFLVKMRECIVPET